MAVNLHRILSALIFVATVGDLTAYQDKQPSIQGSVADSWGYAVPGAEVKIGNNATRWRGRVVGVRGDLNFKVAFAVPPDAPSMR